MKNQKRIISFALALSMTFGVFLLPNKISATNGLAQINKNNNCPYSELASVVDLKSGGSLTINETENPLFWEFTDIDKAFKFIASNYNELLVTIAGRSELKPIDQQNWSLYYQEFKELYQNEVYDGTNASVRLLDQFFTVCENHEINAQAKRLYNSGNYNINDLLPLLPYTSPIVDIVKSVPKTRGATFNFNKSAAISYARTYAVNPNTNFKVLSGGDCTNFVSQILEAGGAPRNSNWTPYSGSWSAAHNFEVYWYTRSNSQFASRNFGTFSANLQSGDVIIVDYTSDGRYDHVGFVTAGGSYTGSYYNVTVAQHSGNYNLPVSTSTNGWENNGFNNSRSYVRLRF